MSYASVGSSPTKLKKFSFFIATQDTKIPGKNPGIFDLVGDNPIDWNQLKDDLTEWRSIIKKERLL